VYGLGGCDLSPEVCLAGGSGAGGGGTSGEGWKGEKGVEKVLQSANGEGKQYRVPLVSDKFQKSVMGDSKHNSNARGNGEWKFPFAGGKSLHLEPIGSFAHVGNAGLANRHANGNVVPVLDVAVLFPAGQDSSGSNGVGSTSAFVSGKDYLNHRYGDVSFAWL